MNIGYEDWPSNTSGAELFSPPERQVSADGGKNKPTLGHSLWSIMRVDTPSIHARK